MLNIMAIGGVPASGKTTLMFKLIESADDWNAIEPEKLVNCMYSEKLRLYIIGKYEQDGNQFQGTDRLSMAVHPKAEKFISELAYDYAGKDKHINVLFEGDRLFSSKFIEYCERCADKLSILILNVDSDIVEQRHIDRKDNQSEKFKQAKDTKISNISGSLFFMDYINCMVNNNIDDQKSILNYINNFFGWSD